MSKKLHQYISSLIHLAGVVFSLGSLTDLVIGWLGILAGGGRLRRMSAAALACKVSLF